MDLPTCPSCGQSVLDDEPVSCPFCGAAMDGSSGPTRDPAAAAAPKKKKPSDSSASKKVGRPKRKPSGPTSDKGQRASGQAESEDPFEIAAAPQAQRVVACSPRRTKSRPMPVQCPMCDTEGYLPRAAAGRQVKCCNSECLVPIFTAETPGQKKDTAPPSRLSDQAAAQEDRLAQPESTRNPVLLYAVAGVVLLGLGAGIKFFLDREPDTSKFDKPFEIVIPDGDDPDETHLVDAQSPADSSESPATEPPGTTATRLAEQMVDAARSSTNRDKALSRRHTAEAWHRLGDVEQRQAQYDQLIVVSHQRNRTDDFYRIIPRCQAWWGAVAAGDTDTADRLLTEMSADQATIPDSGLLATEASIRYAAVLVHQGQLQQAQQLVSRLAVDRTVRSRTDLQLHAVWSALAVRQAEEGQNSLSPFSVLLWQDPVAVAVAVELGLHQQWADISRWAEQQTRPDVANEIYSQLARQALWRGQHSGSSAAVEIPAELPTAARQRVDAVLSRQSPERLQSTAAQLLTDPLPTAAMPATLDMFSYQIPPTDSLRQQMRLFTDLACSAAAAGNPEVGAQAIHRLHTLLTSHLPPTTLVRQASQELDQSRRQLEQRIAEAVGRSPGADVSAEFQRYRRGLDRLAAAAERRRLQLIAALCTIVPQDSGISLQQAMQQSPELMQELTLDPLCRLIAAEARLGGGELATLAEIDQPVLPRGKRTSRLEEDQLAGIWLQVVRDSTDNADRHLLQPLESVVILPGLRCCLRRRLVEFRTVPGAPLLLHAAADVKNDVSRENCLWTIAVRATRQGRGTEVEDWLNSQRLTATDRVLTMAGIITALDLSAATGDAVSGTP